jgi:hypothetical protein
VLSKWTEGILSRAALIQPDLIDDRQVPFLAGPIPMGRQHRRMHINAGLGSCMIHGRVSPEPFNEGDLVMVDLTPQVEGYCASLARTFVVGQTR